MIRKKQRFIILSIVSVVLFFSVGLSFIWKGLKVRTDFLLQITLEDPLFYSPEVNVGALKQHIATLIHTEDLLMQDIKYRIKQKSLTNIDSEIDMLKKIVLYGFLPASYLQQLPNAIEKTDIFLEKPTVINAFRMLGAVHGAARSYQKDSTRLYDFVTEANAIRDPSSSFTMDFLGSRVNDTTLLEDLHLVKKNGDQLLKESRSRFSCFLRGICETIVQKNRAITFTLKNTLTSFPTLHDFDLLQDDIVNGGLDQAQRVGPYIIKSGCFPQVYVPMYIFRDNDYGFIAKQADENYYLDFKALIQQSPQNQYAKLFLDHGIEFDDQPEGAEYRCLDLRYWGDLATIDYFRKTLNRDDIISSDDLDMLINEFKGNMDVKNSKKYLHILNNRITDLPFMLAFIADSLNFHRTVFLYSNNITPLHLLSVRSAYSITYNTFSRSIWRLDDVPRYLSEKNTPLSPIYTTYHQLRRSYSDEEIRAFDVNVAEYLE